MYVYVIPPLRGINAIYTKRGWYNIIYHDGTTLMEPHFCSCSAVLYRRCRSVFAICRMRKRMMILIQKKRKLSLSRKGKGRFSSVSEH